MAFWDYVEIRAEAGVDVEMRGVYTIFLIICFCGWHFCIFIAHRWALYHS